MEQKPKLFVATKALITNKGKILVIRESNKYKDGSQAGKFDVIGGRLEPGEKFNESLMREVKEETGLSVNITKPFFVNEAYPKVREEQWQIVRIFFECSCESDTVQLSEDHDEYKWIDPANYKNENLIENLYPVFEAYLKK